MEDNNEINELLTALDDQENNTIINLTSNKIKQQKTTNVKEIILPEQLKCYIKGLEFSIQLLDSVRKHYEKKLMDEDSRD